MSDPEVGGVSLPTWELWEKSPSIEGSWLEGWGQSLPHSREVQPGECQPCSACCQQGSLVHGSLTPGGFEESHHELRLSQVGPLCSSLLSNPTSPPLLPHWWGGGFRPSILPLTQWDTGSGLFFPSAEALANVCVKYVSTVCLFQLFQCMQLFWVKCWGNSWNVLKSSNNMQMITWRENPMAPPTSGNFDKHPFRLCTHKELWIIGKENNKTSNAIW